MNMTVDNKVIMLVKLWDTRMPKASIYNINRVRCWPNERRLWQPPQSIYIIYHNGVKKQKTGLDQLRWQSGNKDEYFFSLEKKLLRYSH